MIRAVLLLPAALAVVLAAASADAFSQNYGDCDDTASGGTVVYQDVTETNGEPGPLYNAPTCALNEIDFNPVNFEARVDGSTSVPLIQGMVDFTIVSVPNGGGTPQSVSSISISEGGDRQIFGFAPGHADASASMDVELTIYVGPGGAVPITFTDSQAVSFSTPGDSSNNTLTWSVSAQFLLAQILDDACLGVGQFSGAPVAAACGAETQKVDVTIDNTLEASAASGFLAFINKKDADSLTVTSDTTPIPEPGTAALLGLGLLGLARARKSPRG